MTMKEKACSYIEKMNQQSLGSPINALSMGYEDGYKDGMEEAFRWREMEKEPPVKNGKIWVWNGDYRNPELRSIDGESLVILREVWKYWRPFEMECI